MEALFGNIATDRKPKSAGSDRSKPELQTRLLDPRKSQNIAIVLRSLAVTRDEILDAVATGRGLTLDTLEKLTNISPTPEEEATILAFSGDPSELPDAESFLYQLLRSVPASPFRRLHAMLFRATFEAEISHHDESLRTLGMACGEIRDYRGIIFLKLLEAVLKAGNRMNAGTVRGNAQAFNLSALLKLSDVKSTDGKTTLLHFVVEEVVRSEGRRCVLNRNHSLGSSGRIAAASPAATTEEERQMEYIRLGLPVIGGLAVEFTNVKRAATIDIESFSPTCSTLQARVKEIQRFIAEVDDQDGGKEDEFVKTMKEFFEQAEQKLEGVRNEEKMVLEQVKRTYDYYQAGASTEKGYHPLQLFVIIKNFLQLVDQVCVDIARNQQKIMKKKRTDVEQLPSNRASIPRFANLPAHFMSLNIDSNRNLTDSDDGF